MRTATFLYEDDEYDVSITVSAATVVMGARRGSIASLQHAKLAESLWGKPKVGAEGAGVAGPVEELVPDEEAFSEYLIRVNTYPACMAGTLAIENLIDSEIVGPARVGLKMDIPAAEFMLLPEQLVVRWLGEIFKLNPHWEPQPAPTSRSAEELEEGEVLEPAEGNSLTNDSSTGSEPPTRKVMKTNRQKAAGMSTT